MSGVGNFFLTDGIRFCTTVVSFQLAGLSSQPLFPPAVFILVQHAPLNWSRTCSSAVVSVWDKTITLSKDRSSESTLKWTINALLQLVLLQKIKYIIGNVVCKEARPALRNTSN